MTTTTTTKTSRAKIVALAMRAVAVGLVAAAPFLPPFELASDERSVVFVLDRSLSVPSEDRALADRLVAEAEALSPDTRFGAVVVDGEARVLRWPGYDPQPLNVPSELGSDLAAGIHLGAAILPSGGARRLVVLTDGRGTTDGAEQAAEAARARSITVDVVALGEGGDDAPRVTRLDAPQTRVAQGEPVEASAEVEGEPGAVRTVDFRRDGRVVASIAVELDERGRGVAELRDPTPEAGVHVYEASVRGTEGRAQRLFVTVSGRPKVLLVSLTDDRAPTLLMRALEDAGEVTHHALEHGRVTEAQLADADLVVLADLPLEQPGLEGSVLSGLHVETQEQLLEYVSESGGGLVVGGGAFGFGPDWADQPISRALPVGIEDQGEVEDPPVAMAMMLDGSGSMGMMVGEYTKIRLAVEGCLAAASTLRAEDRAAIASVEDRTHWIQELAPTAQVIANRHRVRALRAGGGGIYVYTALVDAYAVLTAAPEPIRHVVLFSDTQDSEQQFEHCVFRPCHGAAGRSALELAREARGLGITTTVVGIGAAAGSDAAFLNDLAQAGGGRYYLTEDGADLRRIFVTETRAIARSNLREEDTAPVLGDASPIVDGVGAMPALAGFVQTRRRATADTALLTPDGRPLLASWRYGVGSVVAFTSDLGGRWSGPWNEWEQAPQLFRQMVRAAMRRRSARADVAVAMHGRVAEAVVDVADGVELAPDAVELTAVRASGQTRVLETTLERVGPGRYRARARTDGEPIVVARVHDSTGHVLAEGSAQDPSRAELSGSGPDPRALRELARRGGGEVIETPAQMIRDGAASTPRPEPSWPWALLLAALLVAGDLWVRRLGRPTRRVAIEGLVRGGAPPPSAQRTSEAPLERAA